MLTMDKIKFITGLDRFKGDSLRGISRNTGHHFNTVKKYVDKREWNEERKERKPITSRLDPFKPEIDQWLTNDIDAPRKQRHTAQRVYNRLKGEYRDQLKVSLRTVQIYVAKKKKELYGKDEIGYLPLEHPPGEAQADFGEYYYNNENGQNLKGYTFTLSFPYSNGAYCQTFRGQNQECLLEGLKSIFEYMEKVPTKIWFDNLTAAVISIGKGGERKLVEQFERFALHYGFSANFCNPYSGHEKGSVENKVGYERRNLFVPVPQIKDSEEFNRQLFVECDNDLNRPHYKKEKLIADLLMEDKNAMRRLPEKAFEVCRLIKGKTDKYGKVPYETNLYSASPAVALSEVWIEIRANTITVMTNAYEPIVTHTRIYGHHQEPMIWEPYLALMIKRPNAIKYTGFYNDLPPIWQEHLSMNDHTGKREALKALAFMLKNSGIDIATKALNNTLESGVRDADSLLASYKRISCNLPDLEDIILPSYVPQLDTYQPDLGVYDNLFARRPSQ